MRTSEYELCAEAQKAIHYGLHDVAERIAIVVEKDAWRRFVTPTGREVTHETFASFIVTPQPDGLGTDIDTIKRICRDTPYALDLVDQALQQPDGRPRATVDIVNGNERPDGNGRTTALRRLRKDRPDLHSQVIDGLLTANAAMVEAGFRPRTVTVRLDRVDSIARTLRQNLTAKQLKELREALG